LKRDLLYKGLIPRPDPTTLAHPFSPEKNGVNRLNEPDALGGLFIMNLRDAAVNGSGFIRFSYITSPTTIWSN